MRCTVDAVPALESLAARWQALESLAAPSLFQSWGWIGTWLRLLPDPTALRLLSVRDGDAECGLALLGCYRRRRHGWLMSDTLFLNETGDPALDVLTVEFNGVLAARGTEREIAAAAIRQLVEIRPGWDELVLSGIDRAAGYAALAQEVGLRPHLLSEQPCDYVDLAAIRAAGQDYLAGVSKNTRYQVRRALRRYEERGEVTFRLASTAVEADQFFDRMKALHQAYWTGRGKPGAFGNPFFETFHRAFIADRFDSGEIQMARIAAGDQDIGYLYNILHDHHAYSYQSGFAYEDDAAIKPGLVSHYLAICDALSGAARIYDFMAGSAQHKRSLGTARREMEWIAARQPRLKFGIEDALRRARALVLRRRN